MALFEGFCHFWGIFDVVLNSASIMLKVSKNEGPYIEIKGLENININNASVFISEVHPSSMANCKELLGLYHSLMLLLTWILQD